MLQRIEAVISRRHDGVGIAQTPKICSTCLSGNGVGRRDAPEARIGEQRFPSRPSLVWSAIAQASGGGGGLRESVFQWVAAASGFPLGRYCFGIVQEKEEKLKPA